MAPLAWAVVTLPPATSIASLSAATKALSSGNGSMHPGIDICALSCHDCTNMRVRNSHSIVNLMFALCKLFYL
jgi:hypothetical protein